MDSLIGVRFLDFLSGYQREILSYDNSGDDKYRISVPNQEFAYEVVHKDFITDCIERAGTR